MEVNEHDFERISEIWENENRILESPILGELASQLEPYPQTSGLAVNLIIQEVGFAPKVEIIETDHPLFFEQESGINMDRVISFAERILYQH